MSRSLRALLLALLSLSFTLSACVDKSVDYDVDVEEPSTYEPNPGDTRAIAGHNQDGSLGLFPSDLYSVKDSARYTGRTVTFSSERNPKWRGATRSMADQLAGLDGFGTSAGAWINFFNRIDTDEEIANESAFLGYFEADEVHMMASQVTAHRTQLTIRPLVPIPPNRQAFHFVTTNLKDVDGNAVVQDPVLTAIFSNDTDEEIADYSIELQDRIRNTADRLVEEGIVSHRDDIASLAVFTTQSLYETDLEVAEYIRNYNEQNDYDANATSSNDCAEVAGEPFRLCTFTFEVPNFVEDDGTILDDAVDHVKEPYTMTGYAFLPPDDQVLEDEFDIPRSEDQGYAINIFGHGLGGNALGAADIARHTALSGLATIAIDAPIHGSHPLQPDDIDPDNELDIIIALFGIDLKGSGADIKVKSLRDGWRHSNFDKLALIEALQQGIDLTGDGKIDLDFDRLTYLGGSLGAIQGAQFSALTDVPQAALFAVAGGRLSDIVRYGTLFRVVNKGLFPQQSDASILQSIVLLQTGVEKGDGVNWAHHVLNDRLQSGDGYPNDNIPDVAAQISVPDAIVPAESGMALARALGVDGVGRAALEDPLVQFGHAELTENHASGATAGILQTDCVRRRYPDDPWITSEHGKSADSVEGIKFWTDALTSMFGRDVAPGASMILNDPYAELHIIRGENCADTYIELDD